MDLADTVAVVTGASSGLGTEFSRALVERQATVFGLAFEGGLRGWFERCPVVCWWIDRGFDGLFSGDRIPVAGGGVRGEFFECGDLSPAGGAEPCFAGLGVPEVRAQAGVA